MKPGIIITILSLAFCLNASAQFGGLLKKVKNKTQDKTQQRIDKKIDNEIDQSLDKAEGKKTAPVSSETPAFPSIETEKNSPDNGVKSYAKFDFIPGDSILYAEDFQQEQLGELPLNWNTSGTGEVTTLDKFPGQWLRLHKSFTYLSANSKQLGANYTIELDVILQLKSNGWMYPEFRVGVFASGEEANTGNNFLKHYDKNASVMATLNPGEYGNSKVKLHSELVTKTYYASDAKAYGEMEKFYGKPMHISMQVQNERFRMWINSDKIFDAPRAVPLGHIMNQLIFEIEHTNYAENQYAIFVGNIKMATGKPDTRHKLLEEGKFSTTGILFDFQSAVIKPESYGVVKEIAGVLKENAGIKIKVLGHTSSDGDDNANMELSKKRAAAVKDLLVTEFGIDAARLETEGKGETQPVADNKTREGKTVNRRVEFIKL